VLGYDDERGHLEFLSAHSTLPRDFTGDSLTAEVMCHPSGRAIYVSNQGHDSLAVFSFDELTGSAEYLGVQPTFGRFPRNFNIDPSAAFLLVANQSPGNLVIYRLDPDTFWPVPTGVTLDVPTPTCVLFRPVQTPSLQESKSMIDP
jgi:6-phosphogluconolactonase